MDARAKRAGGMPAMNPRLALLFLATGATLLAAVAFFALTKSSSNAPAGLTGNRAAYLEFGPTVDTLWAAEPERPDARRKVFSAAHASGFGIVASLSPDGRAVAYSVLPADTSTPAPDSPADLYVVTISEGVPRLLGHGIDLLVRPVWAPDSSSVVIRRTEAGDPGAFRLGLVELDSGQERPLVTSSVAIFPVGFSPVDAAFYFVELAPGGSDLRVLSPTGTDLRASAHLADDLTRDWTLSPDGTRLAYLALSLGADHVASRALVLDLSSGKVTNATSAGSDQFGPAWSPRGALSVGQLPPEGSAAAAALTNSQPTLPGPTAGFDVPAGWSRDGRFLALRTFAGTSTSAPGRSVLTVVGPNGFRKVLSSLEVTFIGWIGP